jgi:hypothetical protein
VDVDHGNAPADHLLGEDALAPGRIHAEVDLCGPAADERLVREGGRPAERRVGAHFAVVEDHGDR